MLLLLEICIKQLNKKYIEFLCDYKMLQICVDFISAYAAASTEGEKRTNNCTINRTVRETER